MALHKLHNTTRGGLELCYNLIDIVGKVVILVIRMGSSIHVFLRKLPRLRRADMTSLSMQFWKWGHGLLREAFREPAPKVTSRRRILAWAISAKKQVYTTWGLKLRLKLCYVIYEWLLTGHYYDNMKFYNFNVPQKFKEFDLEYGLREKVGTQNFAKPTFRKV